MTSRRKFLGGALGGAAAVGLRGLAPAAARSGSRARLIFEDLFARPDRNGWGRAWFNQRYNRKWAIRNGKGFYRLPGPERADDYRPNPVLVLDHDVDSVDIRATLSSNNPTARFGVVARAVGYADYYAGYIGPAGVKLVRCGAHHETILRRKKHLQAAPGQRYRMRLKLKGLGPVSLHFKVWRASEPEPDKWMIEHVDASASALTGRGAFGLFFEHGLNGDASAFRVDDVAVRSADRPSTTAPTFAYALAGPPDGITDKTRVVAKTSVPARVRFQVAKDPTFTNDVKTLRVGRTSGRANTAKADIDTSGFTEGSVVYWRPIAVRDDREVVGPTSSFKAPPGRGLPMSFAFGSCTGWGLYPHASFERAHVNLPDMYLHQGDFGYVLGRAITEASDAYQDHWVRLLMDPHLTNMTRDVPLGLYRDDGEYGAPTATRDTLKPFTIGAHNELHANPGGPYTQFRYGDIMFFTIDCRRYSTGRIRPRPDRSRLGQQQTQWLKDSMRAAARQDISLMVVCSPQPFGVENEPASWRRTYTREWNDLMSFFTSLEQPVLIVSGDAHGHRLFEYPQRNLDPTVPRIVEFLSSGTEQNRFFSDLDNQFILRESRGSGFGMVEIGPEREIGGRRVRSLNLTAVRTQDGTPFWTAQYSIVGGVGILPVLTP